MAKAIVTSKDFKINSVNGVIHSIQLNENSEDEQLHFDVDRVESVEKPIFYYDDNFDDTKLMVMSSFNYAFDCAIINLCNRIIKSRQIETEDDKKKKEIDKYKDERKSHPKVVEALQKEFHDVYDDNEEYVKHIKKISVATRFYVGKQGDYIIETSELNQLSTGELMAIINKFIDAKDDAIENLRKDTENNSAWLSTESVIYTKKGQLAYDKIKYKAFYDNNLLNINDLKHIGLFVKIKHLIVKNVKGEEALANIVNKEAYKEIGEYLNNFTGWVYHPTVTKFDSNGIDESDISYTEKCDSYVTSACKEFIVNAINKDQLVI